MSSPTSIDDLPAEIICELFKLLPLKDLVACSAVNRRWRSIFSTFKLYRLVTIDDLLDYHINFCNSNRSVEQVELCHPTTFSHLADRPLLSSLKHLALCGDLPGFDLSKLNGFGQLAHLEIYFELGETNLNLNLPKLKILEFHCFNYYCHVSIDCPELSFLVYGDFDEDNLLNLKHPETIRKLDTDMFRPSKLAQFKNVECLRTTELKNLSKATLRSMPKLKELHFNEKIGRLIRHQYSRNGEIKRTLRQFMDDLKELDRSNFKFRFAGFQLTEATLNEFDFGAELIRRIRDLAPEEYFYARNYHHIDPDDTLEFVYLLDYSLLLRNSVEEIPMCFFEKFTGVKSIVTNGRIEDADHFLNFLKSFSLLKSLTLNRVQLKQEFYDRLPAFAHSLIELVVVGCEPQLNFDFIGRMPFLMRLPINQKLSIKSFLSLIKHFDRLAEGFCYLRSKENTFFIQKKKGSKVYEVSEDHFQWMFEAESKEKMVAFVEQLQSDTVEMGQEFD